MPHYQSHPGDLPRPPSPLRQQLWQFVREQGFPAVISALLGALLVIAVEAMAGFGHFLFNPSGAPTSQQLQSLETGVFGVSVAFLAILLVCWWLAHLVNRHLRGLEEANAFRVNVWRDDPRNKHVTAYDACNIAAQEAKSSIKVIGPHYGRGLEASESHDDYLTRGILIALRKNAETQDTPFAYHRLVQIGGDLTAEQTDEMMTELRATRCLRRDHVADPGLFLHIAHVLAWDSIPGMEVRIFARPYIPSIPSTLLIDRRHVFFSLPTRWNVLDDPAEHYQHSALLPKLRIWAEGLARMLPDAVLPATLRQRIEKMDHVSPRELSQLIHDLVPYAEKVNIAAPAEVERMEMQLKLGFVFGVEDTGTEDGGGITGARFHDLFSKLTIGSVRIERVDQDDLDELKTHPRIRRQSAEIEATAPDPALGEPATSE